MPFSLFCFQLCVPLVKPFNSDYSLAYDSAHNVLYAAFQYSPSTGGVWKYDGKSWTDTGGDDYSIVSLAYDRKHNLLYAGTLGDKSGVLKYTGTEWVNTGGGVLGFWVTCLAYDSAHNLLYAGAGAGVEDIRKEVFGANRTIVITAHQDM